MSKVIIGIHGLGNKPRAELLKEWWLLAISEGLKNNISGKYPKFKFEMVYWADVFHENPKDENCVDPDSEYFLHEKYEPKQMEVQSEKHAVRKKIMDAALIQINKIFLNDDYSLNFTGLNDLIIETYFKDLDAYYNSKPDEKINTAKTSLHNRLKDLLLLHKKDDILLIAHSMGSIVAFDVLTLFTKQIKINTFITIGSPLGLPIVMSKTAKMLRLKNRNIQKPGAPSSIKKAWYNFSDLEDKVAFNYHLNDDFEANRNGVKVIDFEVSNDYLSNGKHNPHKSYGYLRTPELSQKIYSFLMEKQTPFYVSFWRSVCNLFRKRNYITNK